MSDASSFHATNFSAGYGGANVVQSVNFSLSAGEVVGLVAPNGAGKSTLLKGVAGLIPSAGGVEWEGTSIDGLPTWTRSRRGVHYIGESLAVFPGLTVAENLGIAWRGKVSKSAIMDRLSATMFEPLQEFANRRAGKLSGGYQRLLSLAFVLPIAERELLLVDEPFAGLSPTRVAEVTAMVRDAAQIRQCSVVIVDHNLTEIWDLADRIIIMRLGEVAATVTPSEEEGPDVLLQYF